MDAGPEFDSEFCVLRFLPLVNPTSLDAAPGVMYSGTSIFTSAGKIGVRVFKADVSVLLISIVAGSFRTI